MIRIFLVFVLLITGTTAFSQEKVVLQGRITADSLNTSSVNIINLTQKSGTTHNASGGFAIEVREQDTLLFSSVQYEVLEIIITQEILEGKYLEIELSESINELDEVQISNISLTGNLQQDLSRITTFSQTDVGIPLSSKPRLTSIQRKLETASAVQTDSKRNPPGLVNVSLDAILNTFNGKIEMLRKARDNEVLENIVLAGMEAFPVAFFVEELELPEEHIKNFVYYCAENPNFRSLLADGKQLELLEYYQKKALQFKEQRINRQGKILKLNLDWKERGSIFHSNYIPGGDSFNWTIYWC